MSCLSCLRGNHHEQFLGDLGAVMLPGYPTQEQQLWFAVGSVPYPSQPSEGAPTSVLAPQK